MSLNDREIELSTIGYLVAQPKLLIRRCKELKSLPLFRYAPARDLFNVLIAVAEQLAVVPTHLEMRQLVFTEMSKRGHVITQVNGMLNDVDYVYASSPTMVTGQQVQMHIVRRIAQDNYEKLVNASPNEVAGFIAEAQRHFREVIREDTTASHWNEGFSMFSQEGIKQSINWVNELYNATSVGLGWPRLDQRLGGGLRKKEFALGMASTGVGKSLMLINIAANLVPNPKITRVLYYFTDNSREEMAERIGACITRRAIKYEVREEKEYQQSLLHAAGGYNHRLTLIEWPPKTFSIPEIREHIEEFRPVWAQRDYDMGVAPERCGHIDLILLDYLEEFTSGGKKQNDWEEVRDCAVQCKKLAHLLETPLFAVTQGNKESLKEDIHHMHMAGSSTQKNNPASHVLILNKQNSYEKREGKMLMFVPKSRRVDANYVNPMNFDRGKQLLLEDPEQDIYPFEEISQRRRKLQDPNQQGQNGAANTYGNNKGKNKKFTRTHFPAGTQAAPSPHWGSQQTTSTPGAPFVFVKPVQGGNSP